ncbi:hypothetical protein GOV14_06015 [Candidatus Pacearchaeota archaeon]|nr:hypothetical protein [Candidatus Pacearchaeota archaeon]
MIDSELNKKLINLDAAVINALNLFIEQKVPDLDFSSFKRPIVLGSGNAAVTGRILMNHHDAVFADESTYEEKIRNFQGIDGAILISASGEKHSPILARRLNELGLPIKFLTTNPNSSTNGFIKPENMFVFPKNPEAYTYNTSTYMGMMLGKTNENPKQILDFIREQIDPIIPDDLSNFDSIYIIVPEKFDPIREMFLTKFDELFGSKISGRVFTMEQTRHGKTVVPNDGELFVGLGVDNSIFGQHKFNIPLPPDAGFATMMAIGYYFIGQIQKQNPPYFKENIGSYAEFASKSFGSNISPVVE